MQTSQVILDDWQEEILEHDGNVLLCTGRQVGKTTIFAIKAAEYLINNRDKQIIVVSLTEDQAKLIIIMILDYLEKKYKRLISKGKNRPTQNKIRLQNGSNVIARPVGTTGDAVRGFTGDVLIIDEAARMPELVWTAAKPTLMTTAGQLWICSTPFGKQGYFYECFQNREGRFKVWHKNSEEVIQNRPINENWTKDTREKAIVYLEQEKADMSELQYGQEYLGLFLDDLRRFYEDEWIEKVCTLPKPKHIPKHDNYLGVDIARMGGDMTTYEVLHRIEGLKTRIHQISHEQEQYKPTTHTEQRIIQITKALNMNKVGIDAGSGSLGVGIYDHLLDNPDTKRKVIAMNNRALSQDREGKTKLRLKGEDYHDNLKAMGEHGELKLFNDEQIKNSFRSIQIEIPKEKDKISRVRIYGNDSHIVEGIKRAAWLAKKEKSLNLHIHYI